MNKKLLIPLTIGLLGHSCQNISDQTQNKLHDTLISKESTTQATPGIIYDISLSLDQEKIIEEMVKGYFSTYPCDMKELIFAFDKVDDKENETTLGHTQPHTIYLNPEEITDNTSLKNIILHELFHTIKPDALTIVSPYTLQDGYSIVGYHGLSVVVKKDSHQTQFGLFEDAAAEALASWYDHTYHVPNVYYANIGSLMRKMMHRGWLNTVDLISLQQTNDVPGLCQKLLYKNSNKDIELLMGIFNDVYSTDQDLTNDAIKTIEGMRR